MDGPDNADLDGDENRTTTINFKPSFVLIAIDTHPTMFDVRSDEEGNETHPFKDALTACYEIADSLIFSTSRSNYNQFGVVLADEDQKASLVEVESNLLDSVKLLKGKSALSNQDLKAKYQRQGDIDLSAFFRLCRKKFKEINAAYYKRTIIYITNDDDPLKDDAQKKFAALNEAKTFEPSDISLKLITMTDNFDYTRFYNELFHLYSKPPSTEVICEDKDGLVDELSSSIVSRYTKLRYNFFPFKDDYSRSLRVMKVNFIRTAKLYNTHKASRDGKMLVRIKQDPTAQNLAPVTFKTPMGLGESVDFNLKDKYDIFGSKLPLGFHLQYVADRQSDLGVVIDHVSILLIDPKEELGRYFDQFWQYCADKNKVLVCLKKYRNPCEIRYVELIPKYANNQKLFIIKDIPFCQEYRLPKLVKTAEPFQSEASRKQTEVLRRLIEQLTFDYDPKLFANASYGKKKAYVKAKLLGGPEEDVEDPTADTNGIDDQIREIVADIEKVFSINAIPQGKKRRAPAASGRGKKAAK